MWVSGCQPWGTPDLQLTLCGCVVYLRIRIRIRIRMILFRKCKCKMVYNKNELKIYSVEIHLRGGLH